MTDLHKLLKSSWTPTEKFVEATRENMERNGLSADTASVDAIIDLMRRNLIRPQEIQFLSNLTEAESQWYVFAAEVLHERGLGNAKLEDFLKIIDETIVEAEMDGAEDRHSVLLSLKQKLQSVQKN